MHQLALPPALQPVHQIDEFVADQYGVDAEKKCQEQAGSNPIEESGSGKKYERQNSEPCEHHFADREAHRTVTNHNGHYGVNLDRAAIEQLQRKKCVYATHQHDADGQKKYPWVMPVGEDWLHLQVSSGRTPAGTHESIQHSTPRKCPAIIFSPCSRQCLNLFEAIQNSSLAPLLFGSIRLQMFSPFPGSRLNAVHLDMCLFLQLFQA